MEVMSIAVVVMAITFVVLAAFTIPTFIEARKTAIAAREFLTNTSTELQPVLKDLRTIITDLKHMTDTAAETTGDVKLFTEALGDTGRYLKTINSIVGGVAAVVSASSLWMTGAKTASKFILDRLSKKGGTQHGR